MRKTKEKKNVRFRKSIWATTIENGIHIEKLKAYWPKFYVFPFNWNTNSVHHTQNKYFYWNFNRKKPSLLNRSFNCVLVHWKLKQSIVSRIRINNAFHFLYIFMLNGQLQSKKKMITKHCDLINRFPCACNYSIIQTVMSRTI